MCAILNNGPCCSREGAGVAPNCVGKKECSRFGDIYGYIPFFFLFFFVVVGGEFSRL